VRHFSVFVSVAAVSIAAAAHASAPAASCRIVEASTAALQAVQRSTSSSVAWGQRVEYRSFADHTFHSVRAYPGVHVEVLLSDSWTTGPNALTDEATRRLVTRADLLYETYRDLTGSEPRGEGPLRIAMVPMQGAVGYGGRGMKGIEINQDTLLDHRGVLSADASHPLLSHEMAHNFDQSSNSYSIGADRGHAWTALVEHLALVREQGVMKHPDEYLADTIDRLAYPDEWMADPRYSFEVCGAADNNCGSPRVNAMFAYLGLRTLQLHGLERAPRLLTALTQWDERFGRTFDARAAADVYIEILSETAEQDASCYADAWKWYASPALRQRLAARYGPNPFCADADGDGWSWLRGDPDDADPSSHPAAAEVQDGRDNDGDGIVDNAYFRDGVTAGFGLRLPVTFPVVLDGRIDNQVVGDSFRFSMTAAGRVLLNASRRSSFEGAVRLLRIEGGRETYLDAVAFEPYGTTRVSWELAPGLYELSVSGSIPGEYRLAIQHAQPWPVQWGTVSQPVITNGQAKLVVDTNAAALTKTPTHVVFWMDGVGEVARLPWSPHVELEWNAAAAGVTRIRYRARLIDANEPVTSWSLPADSGASSGPRRRAVRH
jgi:hypothetical protein